MLREISFTDDELRVLRAMTQAGDWPVSGKSLKGLIARLESAEGLVFQMSLALESGFTPGSWFIVARELYQAWKKAAGK